MPKSVLFMSFGQSNADVHDAGPAFESNFLDDGRVVIPNDGHGFRGTSGDHPKHPMTGFRKAYGFEKRCQSLAMPAGARFLRHCKDPDIQQVIIRSAAKGGRPLLGFIKGDREIAGIYKDHVGKQSFILQQMMTQARRIVALAAEKGAPISQVFLPFFHGEADRTTPHDLYIHHLTALMNEVDAFFAKLGVPTFWLLTQPSGTGAKNNGNAWSNRLAIQDIADDRKNAALVCANYAYPLFDSSHLDAKGKVLIGELIGLQAARVANGETIRTVRPESVKSHGHIIDVLFSGGPDLELDTTRFPLPLASLGFQVVGQAPDFVQYATVVAPGHVRLTCAASIPDSFTLNYAFASRNGGSEAEDTHYPYGRGCLREKWEGASFTLPGEQILHWVPAFSMVVADAEIVRKVA